MTKVTKFPVSRHKREMNRRGKMSLSCIVSDRWVKVGTPDRDRADLGMPIELTVMRAHSLSTGGDRVLCNLIVTVDQLRALLHEIDVQA